MLIPMGDVILGTAASKNKKKEQIHRNNARVLDTAATKASSASSTSASLAQESYAALQSAGPNTGPLSQKAREVSRESARKYSKEAYETAQKATKLRDAAVKADTAADAAKARPGNLLDIAASFAGITK